MRENTPRAINQCWVTIAGFMEAVLVDENNPKFMDPAKPRLETALFKVPPLNFA